MKLMGHRGARNEAPENTLKGFQHAISLGLGAIELDIHTSKEGELMVIHDETLDRTTNGHGHVNELYLEELKSLDAGDGEKIPTLDEALNLILPHGLEVQIEIKDPKAVKPLIENLNGRDKSHQDLITVISFHHGWLKAHKEALPQIKTAAILYGRPLNPEEVVKACKADGLSLNISFIDQEVRNRTLEAGQSLTAWNANTHEQLARMKELKIDYIATDRPQALLQ